MVWLPKNNSTTSRCWTFGAAEKSAFERTPPTKTECAMKCKYVPKMQLINCIQISNVINNIVPQNLFTIPCLYTYTTWGTHGSRRRNRITVSQVNGNKECITGIRSQQSYLYLWLDRLNDDSQYKYVGRYKYNVGLCSPRLTWRIYCVNVCENRTWLCFLLEHDTKSQVTYLIPYFFIRQSMTLIVKITAKTDGAQTDGKRFLLLNCKHLYNNNEWEMRLRNCKHGDTDNIKWNLMDQRLGWV